MTHSEIRRRTPNEASRRTCAFNDLRHGRCMALPSRILVVPNDTQHKRHMGLCPTHHTSFKKDQPAAYKARLDMSILEWRNYAVTTYGALPACGCVGCQLLS